MVLNDGRKVAAKLIGEDPDNDLAVLKIEGKGFPVARFGRSAGLKVGQMAIAIGNPIGESLNNTVTVGVISALGRNIAAGQELRCAI